MRLAMSPAEHNRVLSPGCGADLYGQRHVLMTADAVGGVWTYALDLCRGLGTRGVHVSLVVLGPPASPAP